MNTSTIDNWKQVLKRCLIVPVLALAMAAGFGTYEILKPTGASAATAAPAATPLDDNTVSALLSLDRAMETVAAHVTPAVVNVTVTARAKAVPLQGQDQDQLQQFFGNPFGQRMMPRQPEIEHGLGSGIVISPDGYIVTNNHVVKDATDIRVTLNDRRVLQAKLVGADPMTDLAVIKVNGSNMVSLPWGDSTALHPGQTVLAFGNPFGFRFTVTRGIISALNRANPYTDDPRKPGEFIQTDAAINPGNSGGALVDARGQVIGINTFLISNSGSFSGMGFAIPSEIARPTVQTLIKYGKVDHAYIGVGITDVTPENAKFFHMDQTVGAVISQVEPDSPGAKAGLKVGDVITGVNGRQVSDVGHLQVIIGQERPGSKVNLDIMRDGKTMTVPVTVDSLHDGKGNSSETSNTERGKARWGIGSDNVTPELREQLQLPGEIHGAVVTNVQPGSSADNAGLARGDVIVEVNRHKVENAADVKRELGNTPAGQDALVLVWSDGGSTFRVLRPTAE
ncbi:MAG TPA: trypsin-like peptidase domain-containing protein [Candidatus Angelobacter sp.]|jgi:serine protease Do|nr:trypsin-like peptidase domain-containing protein [Candidatus Angelobacter sp.]